MSLQGKIFTEAYNTIKQTIRYNSDWMDNEGYFPGAITAVKLDIGRLAKSVDDVGRRIILIGTRFGTVVVFDRYTEQVEDGVWVSSRPNSRVIYELMSKGPIGISEMITIMGSWGNIGDNIGNVIEHMAKELNQPA